MTSSTRRWVTALTAAVALSPARPQTQTTAQSFDELQGILKPAETVIVTDMQGRRVKGSLSALDQDSLSLVTDGRIRTFTQSEVATVRVQDGLSNGALIGAVAGLGAALSILGVAASGEGYVLPSAKLGAPALLSGIGALVGVLVDRAHENHKVVYISPGQTSGPVDAPHLGTDRKACLCPCISR